MSTADIITKAGPYKDVPGSFLFDLATKWMEKRGYPFVRCHKHREYLIIEGWRKVPMWEGDIPSDAMIEAMIAGEIGEVVGDVIGDPKFKRRAPR